MNDSYTFVIKAENYEILSKNVTILPTIPEDKIRFTLTPLKNQKDSNFWPFFIPALVGFVVFIYWFIRFYHGHFFSNPRLEFIVFNSLLVLLILLWPVIVFILLLFGKENIILDGVSFSVFIPVAALIGILSYLLLSIEEVFGQIIPKYKKKSIEWGYVRRIAIAPYIAILGVYDLLNATSLQNVWFVLLFSFFAGMFTKTIEEWLYRSVQKLLPEDLRKKIEARNKYSIEKSELVMKLKVDEDTAYELFKNGIITVKQLACVDIEKIEKIKEDICDLDEIVQKAKEHVKEINKLEKLLTQPELYLLTTKAKVYSISDFAYLDIDSTEGIKEPEKSSLKQKQIKAKEFAKSEDFKLLSFEDLKKLHGICENKAEGDFQEILSLHIDLKKLGILGWGVDDTMKIREIPITTLKQLKEQCANEESKKNLQGKMKDSPRILKLLKNL